MYDCLCETLENANLSMVMESRSAVAWEVCGERTEGRIGKGSEETFGDDGYVQGLDYDVGFMGAYTYQII